MSPPPSAPPPFEAVVAEHGAMVLRVCRAVAGPDADDAWVATFTSALRAYPDLPAGSNVAGWLATIAHHRSIDEVRAARRRPVPTELLPEAGAVADDDDRPDHDDLHRAIGELAPKQRDAVVYRYLAELPYAEVARLLGSNEAAARRSASDGIAKLRARLGRTT